MRLRLDQKGGTLLFHDATGRRTVVGGQVFDVDDATGRSLTANDAKVVMVDTAPAPEPPPEMPPVPEVTATTGAITTSDLKAGGRRGRKRT
jgi:hypothetical protein